MQTIPLIKNEKQSMFINVKDIVLPNSNLFFSKNDPNDIRFGDIVKIIKDYSDLKKFDYVLIGHPDDKGIKLCKGRVGAKFGPDKIRQCFYKLTPHLKKDFIKICDFGNTRVLKNIEETHRLNVSIMERVFEKKVFPITLGGGHDYAFSDILGFINSIKGGEKIGVINIDAHFDVRKKIKTKKSGTPFYELLELNNKKFEGENFLEFAMQYHCNSKYDFEYLNKHCVNIVFFEDMIDENMDVATCFEEELKKMTENINHLILSLDIDSVRKADAPGASASYAIGLSAIDIYRIIKLISKEDKLKMLGIYELNPEYDIDNRTADLIAKLIHTLISTR